MRTRILLLFWGVICLMVLAGCTVTMYTHTSVVPGFEGRPTSIFVVGNAPNLDKYMYGVGRKTAAHLASELNGRGVDAWYYDQASISLARKSLTDSLDACQPEAVLIVNEKLGLMGKSWGSTSVKEFEFETSLLLFGSEEIVWRARTTGKIEGTPSLRNTPVELARQILEKLTAEEIIPQAPAEGE